MKKIMTVFDVQNTPWHVLSFAIKIAKEYGSPIDGIFLRPRSGKQDFAYPFPNDMELTKDRLSDELLAQDNTLLVDDNIKLFSDECENSGVKYEIQKEISLDLFIDNCKSQDLVVADTRADFLDLLLPRIACPVCLASGNELPEKIVLMLDENSSSRNAIDKLTEVLPHVSNLPSSVVSINLTGDQDATNEPYIRQLENRFSNLKVQKLQGNVERELLGFLGDEEDNIMVVMGAFGRSGVSRFFRQSLAKVILEKTRLSLFIVHK
jgi:nucleotide-binding universal stress UspA family protein